MVMYGNTVLFFTPLYTYAAKFTFLVTDFCVSPYLVEIEDKGHELGAYFGSQSLRQDKCRRDYFGSNRWTATPYKGGVFRLTRGQRAATAARIVGIYGENRQNPENIGVATLVLLHRTTDGHHHRARAVSRT
jgi:hypothetical protein